MHLLTLCVAPLQALDEFATKLIQNNHYAKEDVATRRDAVSADDINVAAPSGTLTDVANRIQ